VSKSHPFIGTAVPRRSVPSACAINPTFNDSAKVNGDYVAPAALLLTINAVRLESEEAMLRRSVSIIVMLGFVIGQMEAFPHAHADGQQPADHNARPHIHVAWLANGSQSRDGEHHHRHNADGSHSHSPMPVAETEQDEHDSDAVYLSDDIGVSLPTKSVISLDNFEIISALTLTVVSSTTSTNGCLAERIFPGECSPNRPLWLSLRALRI
jgi:hypothetical protein